MRRIFVGFALLATLFAAGPAPAQSPGPGLTVFGAASLKETLDEIDAAYTRAGGVTVAASYAASSTLARQIEQGAKADVFVSADIAWMDYLAARKLIRDVSRRNLLSNRLALIAPKDSRLKLTPSKNFALAEALGSGRLAMAGPEVPAGRYGTAALTALGVWDQVKDRAAYGENVRAAMTLVARGEAPMGIVYDTDAMAEPSVRIVGLFPGSSHPPIVYPVAVTARSANPAATAYVAFLRGSRAGAIFRRHGFRLLAR